jgi:histidinol-phosphate aminotransferase
MLEEKLLRPDIRTMEPYTPIVPFEVLSARLGRVPEEIIKLDANENPHGPSARALDALANGAFYHIYPDPESNALREAISLYTGAPKNYILAGMGADELIDLVLRAVLSPGDAVIDCPPSFGMYPFSTAVNAGRYVAVPRRGDFSLDVAGIEEAVTNHPDAKVLFLCSPNNPDGSLIDDPTLSRLLDLPLLIVLDEAYIDFAEADGFPSRIDWVMSRDNLVVLRTFSKLAALAGLRVGYGAFPEWLLPHLLKIKQPYNVNVAASLAAIASLDDAERLQENVRRIVAERERLVSALSPFTHLQPYPSHSNFVLFRVLGGWSAAALKQSLQDAGILVRYFQKPGLENCIRISIGRPEDMDRLVTVMREIEGQMEVVNG